MLDPVPGAIDTARKKIKALTVLEVTFSWKMPDNKYTNIICQMVICTIKKKSRVKEMESNGYGACGASLFSTANESLLDRRIYAQKSEEREGGRRGCIPGMCKVLRQELAWVQRGQQG